MKRVSQLLSKTKYITGLQCPRLIWTQIHEPEKIPETDPVTQHIFDQGHLVGELAKKLFPEGIDISTDDFMGNIASTMDLLKEMKPLFEAGVLAGKLPSRVDILYFVALYPTARVLMYGGSFPWASDPDVFTAPCPDAENPVVFELRRLRK